MNIKYIYLEYILNFNELKIMSSNYFGLAGNGQIIWYFDNELDLKSKIIKGKIQRARFGHQRISFFPLWLSNIYDLYLKRRKEHSASHAFVVLDILIDNDLPEYETSFSHDDKYEEHKIVCIFIDYNGSIHIREDIKIDDGRVYYLDRDVDNVPFQKILDNFYQGFPKYHHRFHNCKHFAERISSILYDNNPYTTMYLRFLHRNQSFTYPNKLLILNTCTNNINISRNNNSNNNININASNDINKLLFFNIDNNNNTNKDISGNNNNNDINKLLIFDVDNDDIDNNNNINKLLILNINDDVNTNHNMNIDNVDINKLLILNINSDNIRNNNYNNNSYNNIDNMNNNTIDINNNGIDNNDNKNTDNINSSDNKNIGNNEIGNKNNKNVDNMNNNDINNDINNKNIDNSGNNNIK